MGMSSRERGELIERLKGCYRCTSWQHQGDNCYTRSKSTCSVVTAGFTCGGVHHKLLHGSGVAFCHKILVQVASTGSVGIHGSSDCEDHTSPPDINQPVLLEVQNLVVHGKEAKTIFDKGSSAALITHSYAAKIGLCGEKIAYWLVVVGHDSVLRHTTLYTFKLTDNYGVEHEVRAFGIEQITDDSTQLDLSGVQKVFPGAPREVFNRPTGPIDILIGPMYMDIQPYGGDNEFTRGDCVLSRASLGAVSS